MTLKHLLSLLAFTFCLLFSIGAVAENAEVISADVAVANNHTSIALLINQQVKYVYFTLENPSRLVVDIENLELNDALKALKDQIVANDAFVKGVRVAKFNATTVRLVVDLQSGSKPTISDLSAKQERQHRLVLDIYGDAKVGNSNTKDKENPTIEAQIKLNQIKSSVETSSSDKSEQDKSATDKLPQDKLAQDKPKPADNGNKPMEETGEIKPIIEPLPAELQKKDGSKDSNEVQQTGDTLQGQDKKSSIAKRNKKVITIAVDAGHGGEDPGARGANGSHEKDITLSIAKKLKQKIDEQDGLRAILIRDGDYFVPLGDRVKKARAAKADLFISIHADAFINASARGSSVFALSERGATSASARYLAQKENAVDLIGGVSLDTKDMDLAKTLLDLSQTATIHDGIRLGKSVLKKIGAINKLHTKHVEQAAFAVLKSPDIPSILVETAFISNPQEEAKLNDDDYQNTLANAILAGVKSYIATNPAFARK